MSNLRLTVLGSGTSHGIPVIACDCPVCNSTDPKDKRYRASVFVELESDVPLKEGDFPTSFVIDVGPEFRLQCIEHKIKHLDAVLITHGHADHLNGLDDIRIFSHTQGCVGKSDAEAPNPIEIYANTPCENDIKRRFDYVYKNTQEGGGKPRFDVVNTDKTGASFEIPGKSGTIFCTAVPIMHGNLPVNGYLLQSEKDRMDNAIAYITDCNFIPESSFDLIKGVNHLIIDGLREREHTTHFNFNQALEAAAKIGAKHTWVTHICHNFSYEEINKILAERKESYPTLAGKDVTVESAYDGMILNSEFGIKN